MTLSLTREINALSCEITERKTSLFQESLIAVQASERIRGKRVLVVGGAGTIGSSTLEAIFDRQPACVGVLDPAENNLAELIRDVRNREEPYTGELSCQPLPYGSGLSRSWLAAQLPFDLVLSFAALKHVRSERDEWSIARLLQVNLLEADHFLNSLRMHGHGREGVFFVSTDKAADPVSVMGASKRAMEHLLTAHSSASWGTLPPLPNVSCARFANVAFSDGSLPWAFLMRLAKEQPLSTPGDITRYLVSPRESGDLCLTASLLSGRIVVPVLDRERHQFSFTKVAEHVLRGRGLTPRWCEDEDEVVHALAERRDGEWPVLVTTSDTSGEKTEEVFVAAGEEAEDANVPNVQVIRPVPAPLEALSALLDAIAGAADGNSASGLLSHLERVVPSFSHIKTDKSLDEKR